MCSSHGCELFFSWKLHLQNDIVTYPSVNTPSPKQHHISRCTCHTHPNLLFRVLWSTCISRVHLTWVESPTILHDASQKWHHPLVCVRIDFLVLFVFICIMQYTFASFQCQSSSSSLAIEMASKTHFILFICHLGIFSEEDSNGRGKKVNWSTRL